jgi:hypothetical protein
MTHSGSKLLGRSLLFHDVRLGAVEDILLDAGARRVLGFVVLCGDGTRRMLPLAAAEIADRSVRVPSALVLMEDGFYRGRCRALTDALDAPVRRAGRLVGKLADVAFGEEGEVESLTVDGLGEVPASEGVAIDSAARVRAV